jgi:holo-[acyl-carrier protein] synthase
MIRGIGIDLVDIERFTEVLERTPAMKERIFTHREIRPTMASLAARFAAKEALYKALSAREGKLTSLSWHEAEVMNSESGKPNFLFSGEIARLINGAEVHLSLSHDGALASAFVLIEDRD